MIVSPIAKRRYRLLSGGGVERKKCIVFQEEPKKSAFDLYNMSKGHIVNLTDMKIFAAFSSLFCLCLFHSIEAKSATSYSMNKGSLQADKCLKGTSSLFFSKADNSETNNSYPWLGLESEEFQIFLPERACIGMQKTFRPIGAKDFYFHTGLSPPFVLAS